jgi:hypothetical protein
MAPLPVFTAGTGPRPGVDLRSNRALAELLDDPAGAPERGATVVSFDRDFARFDGIDWEQPV